LVLSGGGPTAVVQQRQIWNLAITLVALGLYFGFPMLRCSGCGELVSEFAARCPACHRGIDDAVEIPEPELSSPGSPEAPIVAETIPTDDPASSIPTHRFTRRVRTGVVVAVLVLASAVSASLALSSSSGGAPAALRGLSGEVVVQSANGTFRWVDPTNDRELRLPPIARSGEPAPVAVSADGNTILYSYGALVSVAGTQFTTRPTSFSAVLPNATQPAPVMPFADQNQAVLVVTRATAGVPANASLIDVADGERTDLGLVDDAAGDPQSVGAFVSVPAELNEPQIVHAASPDTAVELRITGKSPMVLATAAELNRDVGRLSSATTHMEVYPSPTGDSVAVVLDPLTPTSGDVPMVVLNRQGDVLAAITDQSGPIYHRPLSWSPGGHQLAYPTYTTTGVALAIATETGTIYTLPAPAPNTTFGSCTWSPTSADVVCNSQTANRYQWLYALTITGRLVPAPSTGNPLAWIDGLQIPHG
jgi:hypothetical protein